MRNTINYFFCKVNKKYKHFKIAGFLHNVLRVLEESVRSTQLLCFRMLFAAFPLLSSFIGVYSDWIELPKVTPVQRNALLSVALESTTSSSLSTSEHYVRTSTIIPKFTSLPTTQVNTHQESKLFENDTRTDQSNYEHEVYVEVDYEEGEDESQIVEETLQNANKDLFKSETKNLANKLQYLEKLQNELSQQISKYN